ncbi:MAG: cytochrome C oxidase subunit IV family protein [Crocinitomicaceae bacterium]|nr:cytochrome C oxidase subunit IV family protein [Crocinitomicaceae bacterium]
MKKIQLYTYGILIFLTLLTAFIASFQGSKIIIIAIIAIALTKFWLVAFQFMELKKAHPFWKFLIVIFAGLIGGITMILY